MEDPNYNILKKFKNSFNIFPEGESLGRIKA